MPLRGKEHLVLLDRFRHRKEYGETLQVEELSRALAELPGPSTVPPIGSIVAWLKTFPNVPTLPECWAECNGQKIDDLESPLNGQRTPDLNYQSRFLCGGTVSGKQGGEASHALTEAELAVHDHVITGVDLVNSRLAGAQPTYIFNAGVTTTSTDPAGSGDAHENRPPFYSVVWIMRIK